MKSIAFIDTNHGRGHHLTYMRGFCKTMLEAGYRVFCFYPDPDAVQNWLEERGTVSLEYFHPVKMPKLKRKEIPFFGMFPENLPGLGRLPQPIAVLARWNYAATQVRKAVETVGVEPDLVFFNWLDNYFSYYLNGTIVDRLFPYPWSGLYFRPGSLRFGDRKLPLSNVSLDHWSIAKASHCRALTLLDEDIAQTLQGQLPCPVFPFPDFTDETPAKPNCDIVRQIRDKAQGRKIIGLVGSLSKRKGLLTLMEVAQRSAEKDWFFVFAGPLSQAMFNQDFDRELNDDYLKFQSFSESQSKNCFFYLKSIPDDGTFNGVINACDLLFAAYENFQYSSNTLTKAALFQKPLVVSQGYCMDRRVQRFGMGLSIPEGDVEACIDAFDRLLETPNETSLSFDFEGYLQQHSIASLERILKTIVGDSASSSPASPALSSFHS
ncbi:glycosyltransferase [Baaleninema sp.]|uniref:glycosyltransferase n=1 Tax=Baaleninema sp. TaxID=3101197 RepID=UPI003D063438